MFSKTNSNKSIVLYVGLWLAWAAWSIFAVPQLPGGTVTALLDSTLVKALIWLSPILIFRRHIKQTALFQRPFPWLACLILLCATVAFLHTLRLLNGLQNTYVIFDPMFIVFSLSAGVIEELSFRGGFFNIMDSIHGFWPAALINGAMFTLFHYPELLLGQWQGLVSWRTLLIFSMGLVFCWMFKKWRNLALNMTVHTAWNILSYLFCLTG